MLNQVKEWYKLNGVVEYSVELQQITEGCNGLVAINDISIDQKICEIPRHLIVSVDDLQIKYKKYIKYYPNLFNSDLNDDSEFNLLTLFVVLEKHQPESKYQTYFEYVAYPQNVLSWNFERVNSINDKQLKQTIIKMQQGFQKNYQYFQTFLEESAINDITYEDILWAYQLVTTRCFGGDGLINSTSIVPYGDMLNHHDRCQTTHSYNVIPGECNKYRKSNNSQQINDQSMLIFKATECIKQGDQVFNFFGELHNSFLLCWYGFCYRDNIYDAVYAIVDEEYRVINVSSYPFESNINHLIFRKHKLIKNIQYPIYLLILDDVEKYTRLQLSNNPDLAELLLSQLDVLQNHRQLISEASQII